MSPTVHCRVFVAKPVWLVGTAVIEVLSPDGSVQGFQPSERTVTFSGLRISLAVSPVMIKDSRPLFPFQIAHLDDLNLNETRISGAGLKYLVGLKKLGYLHLDFTQITDANLNLIGSMKQLHILDLQGTPITDAGLKHLAGLAGLDFIDLRHTHVTKVGISAVRSAWRPKCEVLNDFEKPAALEP